MAERPIFVPQETGTRLVEAIPISFDWHPGMAPSQKKKNIAELHLAAMRKGIAPILEISSKSEMEIGRKLSAFNLKLNADGYDTTLECAYQGSKVFENGGPYKDLYESESRYAKRDQRLKESGNLVAFSFEGRIYPIVPSTAFYDWLYIRALYPYREWLTRLTQCAGFTDIEFNPLKSINCQARSCATFVALQQRGLLDNAYHSFDTFRDMQRNYSLQ